ncbi:MAG TPA: DUF423 domain-containing protein [Opitutaceae bacterium]|nr:DUF423 domain-containing protein [Opitutaceae bacterium]
MNKFNKIKLAAGLLGLSGVALGAFGAHGLSSQLAARGTVAMWEKAVIYHLVHAVAVLAVAMAPASRRWLGRAAVCWAVGVVFFSGSLYLLALGMSPRWLWPVTPAGGLLFLLGWGFVVADSLCVPSAEKN